MQPHSLVVGGTKGTGRVLVNLLAELGHSPSVLARSCPVEQTAGACYWETDLGSDESISSALANIERQKGPVHNLIFFQRYRGGGEAWESEIRVSLTATRYVIEQMQDRFAEQGGKAIVVVSSIASKLVALEQPAGYHVVKAALEQLVRYYAVTLGPKGIRVNSVSPGTVLKEEARGFYERNPALMDLHRSITPLGRMGTSQDVCNAIAFLCNPAAGFITGQNLIVDGGLSLQSHDSLARKLSALDHVKITR